MSDPGAGYADMAQSQDEWLTRGVLLRRCLAWVIDGVILAVLFALAWSMTVVFGVLTLGLGMPLLGLLPGLPVVYGWLCLASPMSASVGQAMMGLTVRQDADLDRPTGLQALAYVLAYVATIALGAIWFALALFTTRRRAPHDVISGLVVVRRQALQQ